MIGLDLGDQTSRYCAIDEKGEVLFERSVANAREVKLISRRRRKDDKLDARMLAGLAGIDPELLRPIGHRSEQAQLELTQIRVRMVLVEARTAPVNGARGLIPNVFT